MGELFISHSSRDNAAAQDLKKRLSDQGHRSIFLDLDPEAGIQAGASWERTLYTKLRSCRSVVALCTDNYFASPWCFAEIALARMEGKEIFALQTNPFSAETKMPSILTERQFIDLRADPEAGYERLWHAFKVTGIVPAEQREWSPGDAPYPGLRAFEEADAPIFFGREQEILEGVELLNRVRRQGFPRFTLILGASGSGKSSLARAGIVPQLRNERSPFLVVGPFRPGQDPFRELATALAEAFAGGSKAPAAEEILRRLTPTTKAPAMGEDSLRALSASDEGAARQLLLKALGEFERDLTPGPDPLIETVRRLRGMLDQPADDPRHSPNAQTASGSAALIELASSLADQRRKGASVLLLIDQFEELLGHEKEEGDHPAQQFLTLVRAAVETEASPLVVMGTMRSDYLEAFQKAPALCGLKFKSLSVGPMTRENMRQVIVEPAQLGQVELEDGLAELLLDDTGTSDALPLLAFTLRTMWDRFRKDRLLEIKEYREIGGLQGAIAGVADETLETALKAIDEPSLCDAFLSLTRPAEDGAGWVRQAVAWDRFAETDRRALQLFVDQRLLVLREDANLEVAHEALFRSWDRLKAWLDQNREFLLWRKRLGSARREWERVNHDASALLNGPALVEGRTWIKQKAHQLDPADLDFVQRSATADRRRRRARMRALVTLVAFLALAAVAGLVLWRNAEKQKENARRVLKETSQYQQAAAEQHFRQGEWHLGVAYLGRALWLNPQNRDAAQLLHEAVTKDARAQVHEPVSPALRHNHIVSSVNFSPDGLLVVTTSWDKTAQLWETKTGKKRGPALSHAKRIWSASFNFDGTRLATASGDKTARVWDTTSGKQLKEFKHTDEVNSAVFSPDGKLLVTASDDQTVCVWDVETGGPPIRSFPHTGSVNMAEFNPDGIRVVSAADDKSARIWDVESGLQVGEAMMHRNKVGSASFSPDGERVLTGSEDWTAHIWDAQTGASLGEPLTHNGLVNSAVFSPDGTRVVTASGDGTAQIWDAGTCRPMAEPLRHAGGVNAARFSPDGSRVVTASTDQTARIWDAQSGKPLGEPLRHLRDLRDARFSPDGSLVLTASKDKTARLWNARTGVLSGESLRHDDKIVTASFSTDGSRVITAGSDKTARIWNAQTGAQVGETLKHDNRVVSARFSRDGLRVVTASLDRTAKVWDARTGLLITKLPGKDQPGHTGLLFGAAFNPAGTRVITASSDKTAKLWDAKTGVVLRQFRHEAWVTDATFSNGGSRVVTTSWDETARISDAETGKTLRELKHDGTVVSAEFGLNDTLVVTASEDKTARIWSVSDGKPLGNPMKHEGWVLSAKFDANAERVVTASDDNTACVWDARTGQRLAQLRHEGWVLDASFSPDGLYVVTASADKTARIWDSKTGQPIGEPFRHKGEVMSASFSPDGTHILTSSADYTARVWPVRSEKKANFEAPDPLPEVTWLTDFCEALSGFHFSAAGEVNPILADERRESWKKLRDQPASSDWWDALRQSYFKSDSSPARGAIMKPEPDRDTRAGLRNASPAAPLPTP